jgi:hypothetical protein
MFAPAAIALAGPLIQSIIDLTKLFRIDREISSHDISPDERAFVGILAGKFAGKCQVIYPELMPVHLLKDITFTTATIPSGLNQQSISKLLKEDTEKWSVKTPSLSDWFQRVTFMTSLVRLRMVTRTLESSGLAEEIADLQAALKKNKALAGTIEPLKKQIAELEAKLKTAKPGEKEAIQKELDAKRADLAAAQKAQSDIAGQESALARSESYKAQIDELLKLLAAALEAGAASRSALLKDAGEGLTLLTRLIRSSRLEDVLKAACPTGTVCRASALHVSVQKLTGSTLKKTSAFRGTSYTYSGGAIASYLQFGLWEATAPANGAIVGSGTFTGYSGQYKPESEKALGTIKPGKL